MKKQLIYKNEKLIEETILKQAKVLQLLQKVSTELDVLDPDFTLDELIHLIMNSDHHATYFTDVVKDKLLVKMGDQKFGGVAIKKEKLLEMIEVPDFKELRQYIYASDLKKELNVKMFEMNDGVISLKTDYVEKIEERFTYFTENEAGNTTLNLLQDVATTLTKFGKFVNPVNNGSNFFEVGKVKGLKFDAITGDYLVDLNFIREQEQKNSIKL